MDSVDRAALLLILSSARLIGVFLIAPFFTEQYLLGMTRNIVAINLTLIVIPMTALEAAPDYLPMTMIAIIGAKEVLIGVLMGFILSISFWAAEGVGNFLDMQRGSSISQVFDPMLGGQTTSLGLLLNKLLVYIFFSIGGFVLFLNFFYNSFTIWPIFSFIPTITIDTVNAFLHFTDELLRTITLIAAPIAIILFLVEFGMGLMNRFAQQLNVFSLAMPIKSGIAFYLLVLYFAYLIELFKMEILKGDSWLHLLKNVLPAAS